MGLKAHGGLTLAAAYPFRVVFVRHGETDWNAENRLQGQRDTQLNGRGREQAGSLGRTLRAEIGAEIDRIEAAGGFVASPLERARETMAILRAAIGLPAEGYRLDPALMELSFGDWEGLTWAEIRSRCPDGAAARRVEKWGFVPPGGESYAMLAERVRGWLGSLEGEAFVVAHGGVARALMVLIAGEAPEAAASAPIPQGRAIVFDKGRRWLIG